MRFIIYNDFEEAEDVQVAVVVKNGKIIPHVINIGKQWELSDDEVLLASGALSFINADGSQTPTDEDFLAEVLSSTDDAPIMVAINAREMRKMHLCSSIDDNGDSESKDLDIDLLPSVLAEFAKNEWWNLKDGTSQPSIVGSEAAS